MVGFTSFILTQAIENYERSLYNKTMKSPCCQFQAKRFGKDRKGTQRFRCNACGKTFAAPVVKPPGVGRTNKDPRAPRIIPQTTSPIFMMESSV